MARRLLSQSDMYQTLIAILGVLGLLFLILLGGELNTDLDFSLRRFHTAQDPDEAPAAAARGSAMKPMNDPRCVRP